MYHKFLCTFGDLCQLVGFKAGYHWANRKAVRVVRRELEALLKE